MGFGRYKYKKPEQKCVIIAISVPLEVLQKIDEKRKEVKRSTFITKILRQYLEKEENK